ncbi:MAG: PAS domain-containing protein [Polyangiaceae bacterium]|nr:PAS domain-containing protein [Polyangiaceae bacterium]
MPHANDLGRNKDPMITIALVGLLRERGKAIIDRFLAKLRLTDLPPENTPKSVLIDSLPLFLEELADALLRAAGSMPEEQLATAREHGEQRFEHGFDLSAVIREYGLLRSALLDEAESASLPLSIREFDLLSNCINSGIAEAVTEFTRLQLAEQSNLSQRVRESTERAETSDYTLINFVENLPDLAWSARADGHIDFYNRRWYEYTGSTFETMEGWGWESIHDEELLPTVLEHWKHSLVSGEPFEMEFPLRGADGEFRWFLTRVRPVRNREGQVVRWFGTNTDIHDRRETEARIKAAKEESDRLGREHEESLVLLDTLLEQAPIGIGFCDMQLRFVRLNATFAEINGISKEEHIGKSVAEVLELAGRPVNDNFHHVVALGEAIEGELSRTTPAQPGVERWWKVTYYPVRSGARWLGVGALCEEITRKREIDAERAQLLQREKHARRDAERLNRLKDEFLATVSHELRTPLQAMMGWASILSQQSVNPEQLKKGLTIIERNAKAQSQLIDDILDVSSIIAGKVRIRADTFDVRLVLEAALETVSPAAQSKGVELVFEVSGEAGRIVGDADRLQQVVWNLLSNAVKFTPRGGTVTLRASRRDSQLVISVEDTGKGISAEFLPSVFERFRQADSGADRRYGGLGLGLAIVRHLVELHGGTVDASSAGEGKGSAFMVLLPIRATGVPRLHEIPEPEPVTDLKHEVSLVPRALDGLRILVVDDEADARELLALILRNSGAIAVEAVSASQGLAELETGNFDVLVSDIGMPGEDGYTLMRKVRALDDAMLSGIPALALTAYARAEDRRRALGAGFQMHMTKPMDPKHLVAVIAQLAGRMPPPNG